MTRVFDEISDELDSFIGTTAVEFQEEASKQIAEEWVKKLIDKVMHDEVRPGLKASTKRVKKGRFERGEISRKSAINRPWFETGKLIQKITVIHTWIPSRQTTVLDVGIFDDSTPMDHGKKSAYWIAKRIEYGADDVQARPLFTIVSDEMTVNADSLISIAAEEILRKNFRQWRTIKLRRDSPYTSIGHVIPSGWTFKLKWE